MRMREDKTKKGDRVVGRSCDKLLNEAECVRELFSHTHTHTHTQSLYHSITLSLYHSITLSHSPSVGALWVKRNFVSPKAARWAE